MSRWRRKGGLRAALCTSLRAPSLPCVIMMPTPWGHVLFRTGLHICGLSCFSYVSWEGGIIIPAFSREENEGSAREWLSQGRALLRPASVSLQVKCPF